MRGRIRSVKPEVHLDEELWDLEERTGFPAFRAFVGLWNYADREGRFEWRARALKAVILPYWQGDMERLLNALAETGFVTKYEVDGRMFGAVRTFTEHQSVNHKEPESKIPPPPNTRDEPNREIPGNPGATRESPSPGPGLPSTSGKGRERNGKEGNGIPSVARVPLARAEWTAERQMIVFQREWEEVKKTTATMGGRNVARFHADVVRTAELQKREPEGLFVEALRRWLATPLDDVAKRAPYACFCQAWSELTSSDAIADNANPESVFAEARELLRNGDKERGLQLMKRGKELADREAANAARLG